MLRVISGIRKGHKLKAPGGIDVRPTEDRIKESLFNILGHISDDSLVLDLFGGTGSIGIEFLSRGAGKCFFVDISPHSIAIIKENLIHTKLIDKAIILRKNGIRVIEDFGREDLSFDYIYLDPPFNKHELLINTIESIAKADILKDEGILIVEHEKELVLEERFINFKKVDSRRYGSKSITFYHRAV